MVVKPPSGAKPPPPPATTGPQQGQPAQGKGAAAGTQATPNVVNPEAVAKALKDYQKLKKNLRKPFMRGAAGLFTDNVVFPGDLMDLQNPANDPKYLHLLSAVLGLQDLERFFSTEDQRVEMEEEEEEGEEQRGGGDEEKGKK